MRWYKIEGVPFVRQNMPDPWSIILRNGDSLKFLYTNRGNGIEAFVATNASSSKTLEDELKRVKYLIKPSNEFLISNRINILRRIDRTNFANAIYYSIKSDENGIKALLQYLLDNQGGFCIEINGKHTLTQQLVGIIKMQQFINAAVCPFIDEIPNAYNFNIFAFSNDLQCSNTIADKIVSSFEGLEKDFHIKKTSLFVQEIAKIITKSEVDYLANINNQLCDFGVSFNNDTLTKQNANRNMCENVPEIVFGKSFSGDRKVGISKKELCQHVFIAGGSGSGKGNLLINLIEQFYHNNVNFLVIESAKNELHHLSKWISELKVWRPETGKFVLNPFYLPEGIKCDDYENNFIEIMNGFYNVDANDPDTALPGLFNDTLKKCISKFINNPFKSTQFGIAEFMIEFANLKKLKGYDKNIEKRLRTAGLNRTESSITNEFVLDSNVSIPIQELINGFNVLQLEGLKTDLGKSRFAFVLLNQILAVLQNKGTQELNLVIIIDESHVLIKNTEECKIGSYFHKMIDEFRSRGISIIVTDQSANNIPSGIVNDSYTKIFLGGNDKTGITHFRSKAKLDDLAYDNLFSLSSGQGILISDNNSAGIPFTTENLIDDLDITGFCEYQNSYLENNRITIETYRECDSCIYKGTCTMQDKVNAKIYADYFYNLNDDMLIDIFIDKDKLNFLNNAEVYEELFEKICERTLALSDETFGCYLKQIFRKFNIHYGDNESSQKYDELIEEIIAKRYADNYYITHEELLKKTIIFKNGKIILNNEYAGKLLNTICKNASSLSDAMFLSYLKRVFKKFNDHYIENELGGRYDNLIAAIIKRRKK